MYTVKLTALDAYPKREILGRLEFNTGKLCKIGKICNKPAIANSCLLLIFEPYN